MWRSDSRRQEDIKIDLKIDCKELLMDRVISKMEKRGQEIGKGDNKDCNIENASVVIKEQIEDKDV